jgi:hypothetical protein
LQLISTNLKSKIKYGKLISKTISSKFGWYGNEKQGKGGFGKFSLKKLMLFTICQDWITNFKTQKTNVQKTDKKHKELVLISLEAQTHKQFKK